jgi:hypothetical protein
MTRTEYSFRGVFREWCGADSLSEICPTATNYVFIHLIEILTNPIISRRIELFPFPISNPMGHHGRAP